MPLAWKHLFISFPKLSVANSALSVHSLVEIAITLAPLLDCDRLHTLLQFLLF